MRTQCDVYATRQRTFARLLSTCPVEPSTQHSWRIWVTPPARPVLVFLLDNSPMKATHLNALSAACFMPRWAPSQELRIGGSKHRTSPPVSSARGPNAEDEESRPRIDDGSKTKGLCRTQPTRHKKNVRAHTWAKRRQAQHQHESTSHRPTGHEDQHSPPSSDRQPRVVATHDVFFPPTCRVVRYDAALDAYVISLEPNPAT